jgi:hypothetical protein
MHYHFFSKSYNSYNVNLCGLKFLTRGFAFGDLVGPSEKRG